MNLKAIAVLFVFAFSINAAAYHAVILSTDYSNSYLSLIDMPSHAIKKDIASSHGDDVVRYFNGRVYVLNRYGYDYIQIFNSQMQEIGVWHLEKGSNPHDIAVLNGKAYVTCYDKDYLLVLNEDGKEIKRIDLSEFADGDGIPEANKMAVFGNKIFVTLQRLDRNNYYTPTGVSYLIVIDSSTDEITRAIKLHSTNPFSSPVVDGMYIYIDEVGNWGKEDGGIEKINVLNYNSEGFVLTENMAGGDIVDFDIAPKHEGIKGILIQFLEEFFNINIMRQRIWLITSDSSFHTHLMLYDGNIKDIYSTTGYYIADVECNEKNAWIADREAKDIKVFNENGELIDEMDGISAYPPVHITFIP